MVNISVDKYTPLSQEKLLYIPASEVPDGIARVIYRGKNSSVRESFMALDWLARLVTHIPNKGEQLVRYYGYYSNKSRGMRKKTDTDVEMPALVESDISKKAFRRNWARLIQKIYHTDPLLCPKCSGHMRIISIIEDLAIVKKILIHLNLWATKNHDPPPISSTDIEYACLQVPLIANEKSLNTCRVKAQEVSHEELPQLSFDEFSDDYVIPMPFEDEYSQWIPYED